MSCHRAPWRSPRSSSTCSRRSRERGADEAAEAVLAGARAEVQPLSAGNQEPAIVREAARKLKLLLPQVAAVLGPRQTEYASAIDSLASIRLPEETRTAVAQWIDSHLPTFIYFDDYGRLETRINLQTFLAQRTASPVEPRVRTQMALFEWTHLNPEELQRLGLPIQLNETQEQVQRRKDERVQPDGVGLVQPHRGVDGLVGPAPAHVEHRGRR